MTPEPTPLVTVEALRDAVAEIADRIMRQADCLDHYAEQSGHPAKPVPSVFHFQSSHFRDLANELRQATAIRALSNKGGRDGE